MIRQISVAVGLTPFILSGTILKLLFAGISTSKIFYAEIKLEYNGMIPQKSEWLASLEKLPCHKICMEKSFKKLTTRLCLGLRVCMSVDWALVFPSLLLEESSSTNMNGFCVTSLKVRGVKVRLDNITLFTARLSAFSCKTN